MKYAKWAGWAAVAAGFIYAGREWLAAKRLEQYGNPPAPGAPAPLIPDAWLDYALGTPPPPADGPPRPKPTVRTVIDEALGRPKPPETFHWLDVQSNPSIVREGVGGKARAKHGAGVLIDSSRRRWEIEPRRSSATAAVAASSATVSTQAEGPAAPAVPNDPAEIARRKDASLLALKCAGAAGAALLLW